MAALLPADSVLLPLSEGKLLVSRDHAKFCRVPDRDTAIVEAVLEGRAEAAWLRSDLVDALRAHGFGDAPRPAPAVSRSVQLQVTNACDLGCTYCCTNSGSPRKREVTLPAMLGVVEAARARNGPGSRVGILGGEPLLVPWSIDLAERILDLGLRLSFFTNGIGLSVEDRAARMAAIAKRGGEVRVSLAGATREACDGESGAPRFDQAIAGVHAMARHGALPLVDVMLLPQAVSDVATNLPSLREALPPGTRISFGILYVAGRELGSHVFGSRAALEDALDRVALEAGEVIPATARSPLADRREGCTCALGHHLHVRSDGALFTCFKMEEQVGSLADRSFGDLLDTLPTLARPAASLDPCRTCPLETLCGGGCRSENLGLSGDASVPACGPWRVRVLAELLGEDRPHALEWPAHHLLAEAHARGIEAPERLVTVVGSRHLRE
jgi:radical SAM protein with 4Fe4S-binding SPASM domain